MLLAHRRRRARRGVSKLYYIALGGHRWCIAGGASTFLEDSARKGGILADPKLSQYMGKVLRLIVDLLSETVELPRESTLDRRDQGHVHKVG